jgi:phosphomannomutase
MPKSHKFHSSILRAYDIRGIYGKTLKDEDAFFVAKGFASFLTKNAKNKIVVACDGRVSSPELKKQLIAGLVESGLEVIDVGVGPTPMLYFSVYQLEVDAGIMVTGSHNPKEHNGFKIMLKDRPFYGQDIQDLAIIVNEKDFVEGKGSIHEKEIEDIYIEKIISDCVIGKSESSLLDEIDQFSPKKELKISWDAGNGSAGRIMKKLTQRIFGFHILLFDEIDGNFPNHHPDPTVPENLAALKSSILQNNCDLGIAFDGDGDRIGVMDNEGEILWPDQLMALYAKEVLLSHPGATIISDVKASDILFSEIQKHGGKPLMWKTGHSLIKAKMKETNSPLAGEMSGHIFFADKYFGYDDALYAAIRLINIIYASSLSLADLRKSLPQAFSTPEIRIECDDDKKFKMITKIIANLEKHKVKFNDVDGIRVSKHKGWWLIRASNTQPVLVARAESDSLENLELLKQDIKEQLHFCKIKVPDELTSS